jgi:hypothetical protein
MQGFDGRNEVHIPISLSKRQPSMAVSLVDEWKGGIVRITAKRRHWPKNVERLCGAKLAPLGESDGTVQLEILAAVKMALLIEMIVYG